MKKLFPCPLDCFDLCTIEATIKDSKVIKLEGNKENLLTQGIICSKGKKHLDRQYDKNRLKKPLKKIGNQFVEVSWQEAIDLIVENLKPLKNDTKRILYYEDYGYAGMSKTLAEVFFNHMGGCTMFEGGLCWSAGQKAQKYDFGNTIGPHFSEVLYSKNIVLWGKNPKSTSIHSSMWIQKAKKNGSNIVVIDPIFTQSANIADEFFCINPGTDGALAMGIIFEILSQNKQDENFLNNHTFKSNEFCENILKNWSLEKASQITSISVSQIKRLAEIFIQKPTMTYMGYGLQRYINGGETVRCIDALSAISGNIGIKGSGAIYSQKSIGEYTGQTLKDSLKYKKVFNTYKKAKLGEFLNQNWQNIDFMYITKANPLVQAPDVNEIEKGFKKIKFKLGIDLFMTDTMKACDLILPATTIMEEEDFLYSSMYSPYLGYSEGFLDHNLIGEFELLKILAKKLDIKTYPSWDKETFFKYEFKSLMKKFDVNYETLKSNTFYIKQETPWKDFVFETPSKKFEFVSQRAKEDGHSDIIDYKPCYIEDKKLRLLTTHIPNSINSQSFKDVFDLPNFYFSNETIKKLNLKEDEEVYIYNKKGKIKGIIKEKIMANDVVMVYQGYWSNSGRVNELTESFNSNMGDQAAYYDTFCFVEKI